MRNSIIITYFEVQNRIEIYNPLKILIMTNLKNSIVTPFINQSFEDLRFTGSFTADENAIYIHNEATILRGKKGQIYAQLTGNESLTVELLNAFEGITAEFKNGSIVVNGYNWDGKKTELNLFID